MGLFSKLRSKDKEVNGVVSPKSKRKAVPYTNGVVVPTPPPKSLWEGDAWIREEVEPEEIQELLSGCTHELKSRSLDMPFLLLPFRPASDPSAARTLIRNFFSSERGFELKGERLEQELILTEPVVCTFLQQVSQPSKAWGKSTSFRSKSPSHTRVELFHCFGSCLEQGMIYRPLCECYDYLSKQKAPDTQTMYLNFLA